MSNTTQVFEFTEREADFNDKFLRDNADMLPDWFKEWAIGMSSVNAGRDDDLEDFLGQQSFVPSLGVVRSTNFSLPDTVATAVEFEGIDFQSTSVFDWVLTDPTKLSILESGIVLVVGNGAFAASAGGDVRSLSVSLNGIDSRGAGESGPLGGAETVECSAAAIVPVEAGDYFTLSLRQDSGGALNSVGDLALAYLGKAG